MRSLVFLFGLVLLVSSGSAQAGIKVDELQSAQVEIAVGLDQIEQVKDDEGNWLGIRSPDFTYLGFETLGVWVPVDVLLLGAPSDGTARLDLIDASWNEISENDASEFLRRLGEKLSDLPQEPASITSDGFYRHRRIIGVRLTPLVRESSSGRIKVFESFKVRVTFSSKSPNLLSPLPLESDNAADFFRCVLANYGQAKKWLEPLKSTSVSDYFTNSSNWVKIFIDTTGIYCLTGKDLAGAGISIVGADTRTIRIYTNGGLPLSESLADTNAPWMKQVAVLVKDGGDNRFDQNDSLIFYGLGLRDWAYLYDPTLSRETFFKHFYSTRNCYWLTWGGNFNESPKRMEARLLPGCDGLDYTDVRSFKAKVHLEEDNFEEFNIGAEDGWYWAYLRPGSRLDVTIPTPSCDNSMPALLKVRFGSYEAPPNDTSYYYYVKLLLNGSKIHEEKWDARYISRSVKDLVAAATLSQSESQTLRIDLPYSLPDPTGVLYDRLVFAWVDLYYNKKLEANGNSLFFDSPDSSGTFRFEISNFSSPTVYAFDVTDQFNVKRLENVSISPGYKVAFCDTVSTPRRYAVVSRNGMLKPRSIEVANIEGIRRNATKEYCIITHRDLLTAAEMLASFHRGRGMGVEVVTVDKIYDEFGWGIPDATAIRDFLRWRYWNGNLGLVLLLGDATWDVMGRKGASGNPNYVPTYERRFLPPVRNPYNTDDWFAYLVPEPGDSMAKFPTVGISRLPAVSPQDAIELVERTIGYISNPDIGTWQNRVILIADDDRIGGRCDATPHTRYAEELADKAIPAEFEQVKIYLTEYPIEISGQKTAARKDLVENLNKGALITDFTGHGDPLRLAQEEVYNKATLSLINNGRRRTFFIAASCNVSRFDDLSGSSIAEDLIRRREGGSIGSLGSTHLCTAFENQQLNLNFLKQLFNGNFRKNPVAIADAASLAKMVITSSGPPLAGIQRNNEMYALFGDAALTLSYPRYEIRFQKDFSDTLKKRGSYSFRASIVDSEGKEVNSFSGDALIFVREAEDTTGYLSCTGFLFDYEMPGDEIFRGTSRVTSGKFDSRFFILATARTGRRATVRCFASHGQNSAIGLIDSLLIEGVAPTEDNIGPQIDVYAAGKSIANGDTLLVGERIEIGLTDSSGIALRGKSRLLPGVSVTFDEIYSIDLGDSLIAVDGGYTKWATAFTIPAIAAGNHKMSISASDNIGNVTSKEYEVFVTKGIFEAANVAFAYPNPANEMCYIIWQYDCNPSTEVEIDVSIFTISGRKIWKDRKIGQGPYQEIVWRCEDMAGDPVANGTYIALIESRSPDDPSIKTRDRVIIMVAR